jgi:chromosome segregation ATPase
MEFRDYAAKETSAAVVRLLAARAEASQQQLRALRDAFDRAVKEAEGAAEAPPEIDTDLQELVRRLNNAATAAVRAAAQRIQEEAAATLLGVQTELDGERTRAEDLAAQLAESRTEAAALRTELQAEADRAARAEHTLSEATQRNEEVEAARLLAETGRQEEAAARASAEEQVRDTRRQLEAVRAEAYELTSKVTATARILDGEREEHGQTRDALAAAEQHLREVESARTRLDNELQFVRRGLDDAMAESARLAVQVESDAAERATMTADLDVCHESIARLEHKCAAADSHAREQSEARAAAEHEVQLLRRSLEDAISDAARLTVRLEDAAGDHTGTLAELNTARAELDDLRSHRGELEGERNDALAGLRSLEETYADQSETVRSLEARLESAVQTEIQLRVEAEGHEQELAGRLAQLESVREQLASLTSLFDASLQAADDLAAAHNINEVLTALVRQLSTVYSRVAMFRVKGNKLEGDYQIGFNLTTDVTKLVIPLSVDSLMARAASSGVIETHTGSESDERKQAPFGSSTAAALAVPIVVRGETLAVVYAEEAESGSDVPAVPTASHETFARLLSHHTVAQITRMSDELRAVTELRDYATMLVQEAAQMYSADTEAGRSPDELRTRLKDTIDCARQLFTQRASLDNPGAIVLIDDQIAAAIEAEAGSPFASDLAAASGISERTGRAAEAS